MTTNTQQIMIQRAKNDRKLGFLSVLFGVVGWFASFQLLTEYIKTLQIEDYVANCSFSVLVTCGPNMGSWQGSVFGFSNTILGVAMFIAPILMGVAMLAKVRFPRWWWHIYSVGLLFGVSFVFWLSYQSIFSLHTLCPWCMVVWLVMIPLFWLSITHIYGSGVSDRKAWRNIYSLRWVIILFCYLLIATVAQVKLDWLAEF